MNKRAVPTLVALGVSLAVLTACAAGDTDPTAGEAVTPAPIDTNALNPGPAAQGHAVEPGTADEVPPQWDQQAKSTAVDTAVKAMKLYARPSVDAQQWIADIRPLATLEFLDDYEGIRTEFIAVTAPEDSGELEFDPDNGYGCTVLIGSETGTYTVDLLRLDGKRPWKVNAVIPPLGKETQQ